jgi:hypothetical protein
MRVCASHNQDLPCIQGVHPHPTPRMRHVFPVRRKRTPSSYAVQMGQTSPRGHRCSRGTNNPVRAAALCPGGPAEGPGRSLGSGCGGRAAAGRPPARGAASRRQSKRTVGRWGFVVYPVGPTVRSSRSGRRPVTVTAGGVASPRGAEPGSAYGSADSQTPVRGGSSAPPRTPRRCWRECARAH